MNQQLEITANRRRGKTGEAGVSIVEMLIVVVMISIVAAFAVMQISASQRKVRLTNSAREFLGWLEKARLDSSRRHPMSTSEMASVTLNNANSYTVVMDQNGDGTLDPGRTITFPGTHGAGFSGVTVPSTIRFNWRCRPVDSSGNFINISFSLSDAAGNTNPITLTSAGDTSLESSASTTTIGVSSVSSNANIKKKIGP